MSSPKVLLVMSVCTRDAVEPDSFAPPTGLFWLRHHLHKHGFDCDMADLRLCDDAVCIGRVGDGRYDIVGASVTHWNMAADLDLPVERRALVLGDMLELGPSAAALHREVLEAALRRGLSPVLTVGERASAAGEEVAATAPPGTVVRCGEDPAADVRAALGGRRALVLLKASRRLGLDRLADALARGDDPTG